MLLRIHRKKLKKRSSLHQSELKCRHKLMDLDGLISFFQQQLNRERKDTEQLPWYYLLIVEFKFTSKILFDTFIHSPMCTYNLIHVEPIRSWVGSRLISILEQYPSGVTDAIVLSELQSAVRYLPSPLFFFPLFLFPASCLI